MIDPLALAKLLGTTPTAIAELMNSVPTKPADLRRLARRLGIDYESLRTFTDDALAPLTGLDDETQLMIRLWQKLDAKRRATVLALLADMTAARGKRVPKKNK
ncbi:MAG: hypothetical protein ACT4UQ_05275 [Gammaproteobacteria bacterium]